MATQKQLEDFVASDEGMSIISGSLGIKNPTYTNSTHSPIVDVWFKRRIRVLVYTSASALTDEDIGRAVRYAASREPAVILLVAKMIPNDIDKAIRYLNTLNLKQAEKEKLGIVFLASIFIEREDKLSLHFPLRRQIHL